MLGPVGSVEIFEASNVAINGVSAWVLGSFCDIAISGRIFPALPGSSRTRALLSCAFCRSRAVC